MQKSAAGKIAKAFMVSVKEILSLGGDVMRIGSSSEGYWKYLIALFLISLWVNSTGIGVNIPSVRRAELVVSDETLDGLVPALLDTRREVYESYETGERDPNVWRAFNPYDKYTDNIIINTVSGPKHVPKWIVNNMRSFLLQSFNPDEQQVITMLERIKTSPRRPDPGIYYYGGLYVYSAGAFLYLCSQLRVVTLTSDLSYYFHNQREMRKIYLILKFWGILFTSLAIFPVFYSAALLFDSRSGLLAALFYAIIPGIALDSSILKPYGFSLFWTALAFLLMVLFAKKGGRKLFVILSVFTGLALGAFYLQGVIMPAFFMALYISPSRNNKISLCIKGAAIAFVAFLITNPYFLLNIDVAYQEIMYSSTTAPFSLSLRKMLIYLFRTLPAELSWGIYLLSLAGFARVLKDRNPLQLLLCAVCVPGMLYTCFSQYFYAHYSVIFIPFLAIAAGVAAGELWDRGRVGRAAVAVAVIIGLANTGYYVHLLFREDTRITAGAWINANVPQGSSIAAASSFSGMAGYPAFRMWDYRLLPFAAIDTKDKFQYYIRTAKARGCLAESGGFADKFDLVWRGKNDIDFFEKIFLTKHIVKNYGGEITIYKRK